MSDLKFSAKQIEAMAVLAGDCRFSALVGGARSGKTFLAVRGIVLRAMKGAHSRHAILRFRANAARASISLDTLPAVMRVAFPHEYFPEVERREETIKAGWRMKERRQDGYFSLVRLHRESLSRGGLEQIDTGSTIWICGLDDKERAEKILGQEYVSLFLNECSQIPYGSAQLAITRVAQVVDGIRQRIWMDLNPTGKGHWTNKMFGEKVDPISWRPLKNPDDYQRVFLNPIDNAHNLSDEYIESLKDLPERARKRFYEGVYADDVDGALWTYEIIESRRRDLEDIPVERRAQVVVALDPSGAHSSKDTGADEIGIVVCARDTDGDGWVLADLSQRCSPEEWGRIAVKAYHDWQADCIIGEKNFGGDMVAATIRAVDPNVPFRGVTASRGKAIRAEPISTLYAKGKIHHAGRFPVLEDQMCSFNASGYTGIGSPDHADAAIHGLTYLVGSKSSAGMIEYYRRMVEEDKTEPARGGKTLSLPAPVRKVRLRAPEGVTNVYGRDGEAYNVAADGLIEVPENDAGPLRAAGFAEVELVEG